MNMRSFVSLSFVRVFVLGAALCLGACGGGGGGASGSVSASADAGETGDYLPNAVRFMPEHITQAELEIDHSRFRLNFSCLRDYPTGECIFGPLAPTGGVVEDKRSGSGPEPLRGSWEQRADNSPNCIQGLRIYRSGANGEVDFIDYLSISIQRREDDPAVIDNTIVLSGSVASGTLLFGEGAHALAGARVRLVYTIDAAHVNAQTHGAPAAK